MTKHSKKASLSKSELEQLDDFLATVGPTAMSLEELDGFFCALVAGPETVMPSEYWPEVLGTDEFEFTSMEDARKTMDLVMRHWNHIATTLEAEDHYSLILRVDEKRKT